MGDTTTKKGDIERICKNCKFYDPEDKVCEHRSETVDDNRHCNMYEQLPESEIRQRTKIQKKIQQTQIKLDKQARKDQETNIQRASYITTPDTIIQQVYDPEHNKSTYLVSNDGKIKSYSQYIYQSLEYRPIEAEEVKLRVITLPSGVADYGTVTGLVEEIKEHIRTYLDISDEFRQFAAWWVLLTWVYDKFSTINYLRALGDAGCGKTRFLNVIGGLCFVGTKGSGAVSVAALKRITKRWQGTLIVDEGDFRDSDEKSELVKFFNLGFEKDSPMITCDKNDPAKLEFFIPYCPKIIATRKSFTDKALETRCLTYIMTKTRRKDMPYILPVKFSKEQAHLRNKLLQFRFNHYHKINTDKLLDNDIMDYDIEPRLKQATYAFASMFSDIPEVLDNFKQFLKKYQDDLVEERANSFDGQIVTTIANIINEGNTNITMKIIVDKMTEDNWKTNVRVVGSHMKSMGVRTHPKKVDGATIRKIIFTEEVWPDIVDRYVGDKELAKVALSVIERSESTNKLPQFAGQMNIEPKTTTEEIIDDIEKTKEQEPPETIPNNEELVEFIRDAGQKGYESITFIDRYGQARLDILLRRGDIFETNGLLRIMD